MARVVVARAMARLDCGQDRLDCGQDRLDCVGRLGCVGSLDCVGRLDCVGKLDCVESWTVGKLDLCFAEPPLN